jgi:hypothetical protein
MYVPKTTLAGSGTCCFVKPGMFHFFHKSDHREYILKLPSFKYPGYNKPFAFRKVKVFTIYAQNAYPGRGNISSGSIFMFLNYKIPASEDVLIDYYYHHFSVTSSRFIE